MYLLYGLSKEPLIVISIACVFWITLIYILVRYSPKSRDRFTMLVKENTCERKKFDRITKQIELINDDINLNENRIDAQIRRWTIKYSCNAEPMINYYKLFLDASKLGHKFKWLINRPPYQLNQIVKYNIFTDAKRK